MQINDRAVAVVQPDFKASYRRRSSQVMKNWLSEVTGWIVSASVFRWSFSLFVAFSRPGLTFQVHYALFGPCETSRYERLLTTHCTAASASFQMRSFLTWQLCLCDLLLKTKGKAYGFWSVNVKTCET